MFYCLWKAHVEQIPHKFFGFNGMFSLCAVKTYVENIPWKPGFKHQKAIWISNINTFYNIGMWVTLFTSQIWEEMLNLFLKLIAFFK